MEVAAGEDIKLKQHYRFEEIYEFVSVSKYPDYVKNKGEKANFRRASKSFCVISGKLIYLKRKKDGSVSEVRKMFMYYNIYIQSNS